MKNTMIKLKALAIAGIAMRLALSAQAEVVEGSRAPDYAEATGNDWLFNHGIPGKQCPDESAADNGIDMFYVYPTLTKEGIVAVDKFVILDDPTVRTPDSWDPGTAIGAYRMSGRCFGDFAHVYAPYYRQATFEVAMDVATNGVPAKQISPTANADYCTALFNGPAYADVTNALETYFAKWNSGRKFILAGHSQGSAILRLVMERYFTQDDTHKAYLKQLVASYQVGYGVDRQWVSKLAENTKTYGFDGVAFATNATDAGVVVSYNTFGPGGCDGNSVLVPADAIAVNPILWTTDTTPANSNLNLGAVLSYLDPLTVVPGRYGARVSARGTVECAELPTSSYVSPEAFGMKSFHGRDYYAYWENLRVNVRERSAKMVGIAKLCTTNWPAHLCVSNGYYKTNADPSDETGKKWVKTAGGTIWVPTNDLLHVCAYLVPEKGYRMFVNGKEKAFIEDMFDASALNADGEFMHGFAQEITFEWIQRAPDYAAADGKDWLFNHDIEGKKYAGEPPDDPGVDLFYLYPTSVSKTNDHAVDNICDIDDETMRSDGDEGALGSWKMSGEVFGGYTRVYAPYYRQTPVDFELMFVHEGEGTTDANDRIVEYWYDRAPYADVTNALTYYFSEINRNGERPFIFAGHSHGSGMLRLVMERFFTNETQKAWLKNMVACYAVGFGVGKDVEKTIREKAGVPFATNATDTGVYVVWNTQGPVDAANPGILWPPNAAASVNPIAWTRETDAYAAAALNLGGWTTNEPSTIVAGLYDASNFVANGTIVCSSPDVAGKYYPSRIGFGEKSLHEWDYKLYWENVRQNGWTRSLSVSGLKKVETATIPAVEGTSWRVEVKGEGQGQEWIEAVKSPVDGCYYVSGTAAPEDVRLTYTMDDSSSGKRFMNGETMTSFAMKYEGGVWSTKANAAEIAAATKTSTPKLQLGVVAQRYPWDGKIDVQYRALYVPTGTPAVITVKVNGVDYTQDIELVNGQNTAVVTNLPAELKAKNVKATLKLK